MKLRHFFLTTHLLLFMTAVILLPAYSYGEIFTNKLGMRFIRISKGQFMMGSPESEPGRQWNEKQHRVVISKDFYMGETEVTQGQWEKLVGFNPSSFPEMGSQFPVDTVSWHQCIEFIRVLNQWENTTKYRLPTEAEWEYACRAGTQTPFAGGMLTSMSCSVPEPALLEMAWYCHNSGLASPPRDFKPHAVRTKLPNAWGLYDMHGNVQEWVMDSCKWRNFWRAKVGAVTQTYKDGIVDPLNRSGNHRVIRGGGWYQNSKYQRSAYRGYYKPVVKRNSLGFRIVRDF